MCNKRNARVDGQNTFNLKKKRRNKNKSKNYALPL